MDHLLGKAAARSERGEPLDLEGVRPLTGRSWEYQTAAGAKAPSMLRESPTRSYPKPQIITQRELDVALPNYGHAMVRMADTDPVMAVPDKLALSKPQDTTTEAAEPDHIGPLPFWAAVRRHPVILCDKHKKTYYAVTMKEATQVVTVQDDVQKEGD